MNKKSIKLFSILALSALGLISCGDRTSSTVPTSSTANSSTTSSIVADSSSVQTSSVKNDSSVKEDSSVKGNSSVEDSSVLNSSVEDSSVLNSSVEDSSTPASSIDASSQDNSSLEDSSVENSSVEQVVLPEKGLVMNYNYPNCPNPIIKEYTGTARRFQLYSLFDVNASGDISESFRNIPIPERPGYRFVGWFDSDTPSDVSLEKTTDFTQAKSGLYNVYAQWEAVSGTNTAIIECEHTPELISKATMGLGYSGGTTEWASFIIADTTGTASNDAFLSYLYAEGFSLDFRFYSTKDTTATLSMRYSNEFVDLLLDQDSYPISINGTSISYSLERQHVGQPSDVMDFVDFDLGTISIQKGMNVITCTSNNDYATGTGTMQAIAPLLDCFKITSDAAISYISNHM